MRRKVLKGRWHQNIILHGKEAPSENAARKNSNFWNEGKWNNFIKPLLPTDPQERTFIEIGSNVGLYLKMAKEYGFKHVIGIERGKANCKMAEYYREDNKLDYKIIHGTVGEDFDVDSLPVADVILFANSHYYIPIDKLVKVLDTLLYKTQYCIVVSRHLKETALQFQYTPSGEIDGIRVLFKDWDEMDGRNTTGYMMMDDPHPRELWSLLFKGKLERNCIDRYLKLHYFSFSLRDLTRRVHDGSEIDLKNTRYYRKIEERNTKNKEHKTDIDICTLVARKIELIKSLKEEGQKEYILVSMWNRVIDGGTRTVILKELGYNSVLVRKI